MGTQHSETGDYTSAGNTSGDYAVWYGDGTVQGSELIAEDSNVAWVIAYAEQVIRNAPADMRILITTCRDTDTGYEDMPLLIFRPLPYIVS